MIEFNIAEMMRAKGVKSPYKKLVKSGMSHTTAKGYMTGKRGSINLEHVEVFCTLLRCTPSELFAWSPSQPADDYPENPLQPIRKKPLINLEETLKNMSVKEIEERLGG